MKAYMKRTGSYMATTRLTVTVISRPTDSSGGVGSDNTDFVNITIYAEVQGDTDRQTIFSRDFNFYTQSWE